MADILVPAAEWTATVIEAIGIGIIGLVAVFTFLYFVWLLMLKHEIGRIYRRARQILGRGIIFGLEFLVAADIIHTVAVELTLESVGVLAIIVMIRTFLSFALETELSGRPPWRKVEEPEEQKPAGAP